ncbi:MAG: asparagine synthetase B family protein, partial [Solirubrobacteraceae bacterium]
MARQTARPVDTFTIGFDDREGFDERPYARAVARAYGTAHHEEVVHPNAVDLVERLVWHHDQPFGDSSAVPTFLLSEVTGREVTVALSGDGGDELFAGHAPLGLPDAYRSWLSFVEEPLRRQMLAEADEGALEDYRRIWESSDGAEPLDRLLNLNLRTYLVDDLLVKVDRMSMAHGLEVRSPFLDTELVDLALRVRPAAKVRGRRSSGCCAARWPTCCPPRSSRAKRGFGVPLDRWFREDLGVYVDST